MNRATVDATVEQMKHLAQDNLVQDGYLTFCALMFMPETMVPMSMSQAIDEIQKAYDLGDVSGGQTMKKAMWKAVRDRIKERGAIGVIVIGEAWEYVTKPGEVVRMGGDDPSKVVTLAPIAHFKPREEKREIINMTWEFRLDDGTKREGSFAQVFDRVRGRIVLGEGKARLGSVEGLQANLLE